MEDELPGYRVARGSDSYRDGMFLEMTDATTGDAVAEIFFSDVTQEMSLSLFRLEVPLVVIEWLIQSARRNLLPVDED